MAKKESSNGAATKVEIPRISIKTVSIQIVGDSPLIVHAWSIKAKTQMLDKQMKKAKTAREAKNPEEDFLSSLYENPAFPWPAMNGDFQKRLKAIIQARHWFPATGYKNCAVSGCRFAEGIKMTEARGAFHVNGDFVEIKGSRPTPREDMVRVGMGTADIRYRAEFQNWNATLSISYNEHMISLDQICNLLNLGGFGVGVGEWRPEKDGQFGRFHVATSG